MVKTDEPDLGALRSELVRQRCAYAGCAAGDQDGAILKPWVSGEVGHVESTSCNHAAVVGKNDLNPSV